MSKPAVVLVHGGSGAPCHWDEVVPLLSEYDVLTPAMPGHLGGRTLTAVAGPRELADGIVAAMDEAGLETAHLIGNSVGGWAAAEVARRGRARSLVLLSPGGGWTPPATRIHRLVKGTWRASRISAPIAPVVMRTGLQRKAAFALMATHGERLSPTMAAAMLRSTAACDLERIEGVLAVSVEALPDGGYPVLLAWSEKDRLLPTPRYSDPWRAAVPHAEWRVLPGVGHLPMVDDPQMVARTIREWVDSAER